MAETRGYRPPLIKTARLIRASIQLLTWENMGSRKVGTTSAGVTKNKECYNYSPYHYNFMNPSTTRGTTIGGMLRIAKVNRT
jgi:hypothetical protein